jgi:hypothetical protein
VTLRTLLTTLDANDDIPRCAGDDDEFRDFEVTIPMPRRIDVNHSGPLTNRSV